jgi:hypothetical protein
VIRAHTRVRSRDEQRYRPLARPVALGVPDQGTDPVPYELIEGPPRYRCSEDGTRVYSLADVAAHDAQFHAKTDGAAGRSTLDPFMLRMESLSLAVKTGGPHEIYSKTTERADAFEAYLRDDPKPEPEPFVRRPAPGVLHRALDRTWDSMREDPSGLKALEGDDGDEEVLELLRQAGDDDLRRASFVASILRALAQSVRADREAASQRAAERSS